MNKNIANEGQNNVTQQKDGKVSEANSSVHDTIAKRAKKSTYDVWKYYTKLDIQEDRKEKAKCKGCGKVFAVGSKNDTSTLWRHVDSCHEIPKYHDIGNMMLDQTAKVRTRHLDHKKFRELVAKAIVVHDFPYSYAEYDVVREINQFLNPKCRFITRKTSVVDVWNLYLREKEKLKQIIAKCPSRVCLTTDLWTAVTTEGYICLTAHFVDDKWNLNSKILAFTHMEPPHSGVELAKKVYDLMVDWGIEKKVFSITLDNASANDNMQKILKDRLNLSKSLICNGDFFHVRCCAHILNRIVQEGLKVTSEAVQKIRDSIRYVRASEARAINFKKCVEQVGITTSMGLRLDVATRWNSTHAMLESAIIYRDAFATLSFHDAGYIHSLTNEEWSRALEMCNFLAPFAAITELISGSSYPTANMYFVQISTIELLLKQHVHNDDPVIRQMALNMIGKFDKYWSDCSIILAIAIILDPRMKFDIIRFTYSQLDPIDYNEKIGYIKRKLYYVFNEYKSLSVMGVQSLSSSTSDIVASACSSSTSNVNENVSATICGRPPLHPIASSVKKSHLSSIAFGTYLKSKSKDIASVEKSELDYYLEEATLDPNLFVDMEVLDYWKTNSARFPCLSKMASDILSIPITTVANESAFSIGSRILTKYRSSLLPDNVQALICTCNWMLGFPAEDDINDVGHSSVEKQTAQAQENLTASHHASNSEKIL